MPAQRNYGSEALVATIPKVEIDLHQDLVYTQSPDHKMLMDIYRPKSAQNEIPAVIFLHGDTANPELVRDAKNWEQFRGWARLLASHGIAAVLFNRRSTDSMSRWEEAKSDIESALGFVRENAEGYGLDRNRMALFALSAGGLWAIPAFLAYGPGIKCLVLYYPRLGYPGLAREEEDWLRAKGVEPDSLATFLATNQLRSVDSLPPVLLVRTAKEHSSLVEAAHLFVQEASRRRFSVQTLDHEGGQHGFDVRDDNDRSRELITSTVSYLEQHLAP